MWARPRNELNDEDSVARVIREIEETSQMALAMRDISVLPRGEGPPALAHWTHLQQRCTLPGPNCVPGSLHYRTNTTLGKDACFCVTYDAAISRMASTIAEVAGHNNEKLPDSHVLKNRVGGLKVTCCYIKQIRNLTFDVQFYCGHV
jgi:hypothetical protein